jgi:hypothetical protein
MTRRDALLAGGCIAVAAIAGWFRPTTLATNAIGAHDAAWRLPTAASLERSSAAQFAATRGVSWVGSGPAGAGTPSSEWTLLGLVGRPDDRAVLVKAGKDPLIKRVGAGDTLPDGSRLVSVGTNGILIDRDGCRMRRPLYPAPEQDKTSGECLPAGNDRGQ